MPHGHSPPPKRSHISPFAQARPGLTMSRSSKQLVTAGTTAATAMGLGARSAYPLSQPAPVLPTMPLSPAMAAEFMRFQQMHQQQQRQQQRVHIAEPASAAMASTAEAIAAPAVLLPHNQLDFTLPARIAAREMNSALLAVQSERSSGAHGSRANRRTKSQRQAAQTARQHEQQPHPHSQTMRARTDAHSQVRAPHSYARVRIGVPASEEKFDTGTGADTDPLECYVAGFFPPLPAASRGTIIPPPSTALPFATITPIRPAASATTPNQQLQHQTAQRPLEPAPPAPPHAAYIHTQQLYYIKTLLQQDSSPGALVASDGSVGATSGAPDRSVDYFKQFEADANDTIVIPAARRRLHVDPLPAVPSSHSFDASVVPPAHSEHQAALANLDDDASTPPEHASVTLPPLTVEVTRSGSPAPSTAGSVASSPGLATTLALHPGRSPRSLPALPSPSASSAAAANAAAAAAAASVAADLVAYKQQRAEARARQAEERAAEEAERKRKANEDLARRMRAEIEQESQRRLAEAEAARTEAHERRIKAAKLEEHLLSRRKEMADKYAARALAEAAAAGTIDLAALESAEGAADPEHMARLLAAAYLSPPGAAATPVSPEELLQYKQAKAEARARQAEEKAAAEAERKRKANEDLARRMRLELERESERRQAEAEVARNEANERRAKAAKLEEQLQARRREMAEKHAEREREKEESAMLDAPTQSNDESANGSGSGSGVLSQVDPLVRACKRGDAVAFESMLLSRWAHILHSARRKHDQAYKEAMRAERKAANQAALMASLVEGAARRRAGGGEPSHRRRASSRRSVSAASASSMSAWPSDSEAASDEEEQQEGGEGTDTAHDDEMAMMGAASRPVHRRAKQGSNASLRSEMSTGSQTLPTASATDLASPRNKLQQQQQQQTEGRNDRSHRIPRTRDRDRRDRRTPSTSSVPDLARSPSQAHNLSTPSAGAGAAPIPEGTTPPTGGRKGAVGISSRRAGGAGGSTSRTRLETPSLSATLEILRRARATEASSSTDIDGKPMASVESLSSLLESGVGAQASPAEMVAYKRFVSFLERSDANGSSILLHAIWRRQPAFVSLLLQLGAPVHTHDSFLNTPLHLACARGLLTSVEELVAAGAPLLSLNVRNKLCWDVPAHTDPRDAVRVASTLHRAVQRQIDSHTGLYAPADLHQLEAFIARKNAQMAEQENEQARQKVVAEAQAAAGMEQVNKPAEEQPTSTGASRSQARASGTHVTRRSSLERGSLRRTGGGGGSSDPADSAQAVAHADSGMADAAAAELAEGPSRLPLISPARQQRRLDEDALPAPASHSDDVAVAATSDGSEPAADDTPAATVTPAAAPLDEDAPAPATHADAASTPPSTDTVLTADGTPAPSE